MSLLRVRCSDCRTLTAVPIDEVLERPASAGKLERPAEALGY